MQRIVLQPAFVLHRRPYRENSFLIELFTVNYGRLTVIAKGVRHGRHAKQGLLQPFIPLTLSWAGKGDLMTLTHVEMRSPMYALKGDCLYAGFYLNELLMYTLARFDPCSEMYHCYEKTLTQLTEKPLNEWALRSFEKQLLTEVGYGLLPQSPLELAENFSPHQFYRFTPHHGFEHIKEGLDQKRGHVFSGKSLLAIGQENWQDDETLKEAKRLFRLALSALLGQRSLHTRQLFIALDKELIA